MMGRHASAETPTSRPLKVALPARHPVIMTSQWTTPLSPQSPFDRFITRTTWIAIGGLVGVEIFINTPVFQQIKPYVLKFLADE